MTNTRIIFEYENCEIEWNGKDQYSFWSIDNTGSRDYKPLETFLNKTAKTIKQAQKICNEFIKKVK